MRVAPSRAPSFSRSGERLFFGVAPVPPEKEEEKDDEEDDEPEVELDIWHWQDPLLQPMQLLNAVRERGHRVP